MVHRPQQYDRGERNHRLIDALLLLRINLQTSDIVPTRPLVRHLRFLLFLGLDVVDSPPFIFLHAHLAAQCQALILVLSQAHALLELREPTVR